MRNLYIVIAIALALVILLILFSFLFFEKEQHRHLFYATEINGEKKASVKVDRYKTADKIIYKSVSSLERELKGLFLQEKIVFGKPGFVFEKFSRETSFSGTIIDAAYIKSSPKAFSFLSRRDSKFSTVSRIHHDKEATPFDKTSLVTYRTLLDKYDFSAAGAQAFNVLYLSSGFLPPARGKIILISVRDDFLSDSGKKIKTEYLIVKAKALPDIDLWVSKKTREIMRIEIKKENLVIRKTASFEDVRVEKSPPLKTSYVSSDVFFTSGDIALAGTLDVPKKDGPHPGVLLVPGEAGLDRENAGIYTELSHALADKGYATLRFDPRGIGKSQGNYSAVTLQEEIKDIENALAYLSGHEKTKSDKIFIVAYSDTCSDLPGLDFSRHPAGGLIMLSVTRKDALGDFESVDVIQKINKSLEIDKKYNETVEALRVETLNLVNNAKTSYVFRQGKRLFTERMKELLERDPLEGFKKLDIPLLIVQGKKDTFASPGYVEEIERSLNERARGLLSVMYFRGRDHSLSAPVRDNESNRYKLDPEVLETITGWIEKELCPQESHAANL